MAMEISNAYNSYANSYVNTYANGANSKKAASESRYTGRNVNKFGNGGKMGESVGGDTGCRKLGSFFNKCDNRQPYVIYTLLD